MQPGSGTKLFTVTGGALIPDIPPGCEALCAKIQPRQGDFVAYVIGSGEPVFRRYRENGGKVILESLNVHFDSFEAAREELESRGTMYVILSIRKVFRPDAVEEEPPASEVKPGQEPEPESDWLTFSEAAKLLKVKRTKMYAMLRSGALRASKIGKLWRIARPSIEKCLMENTYKPGKGDPE